MSRRYRWPTKNHGSCGREQRVNCDQEYGVCSDDVSCQPNVALQGSGHGKFCTGVADEVQNYGSSRACEREAKVDCQWSEWNSWLSSFFVYFGRDHSTSNYIGKGVIDTGCSRFLIGQTTLEKMGTDAFTKMGPEYAADPACEGHDLPFWQR